VKARLVSCAKVLGVGVDVFISSVIIVNNQGGNMPDTDNVGSANKTDDIITEHSCIYCDGKMKFNSVTGLWTCSECGAEWIIAEDYCDHCDGKMRFDTKTGQWVCIDCGIERELDVVEHIQYSNREGLFAGLR